MGRRTFDLDVRTCIHPDYGTIAEKRDELERLLKLTDPEYVHICADVGFLAWAGMASSHFFKKYGSRTDYVHFSDVRKPRSRKGRPQKPKPAVFGNGIVRFRTLARQLESAGYSGWITIDCPGAHEDPVGVARAARTVARDALNLAS